MDYFEQWRYFIEIIDNGGFSQASRKTLVPIVTLSKNLKALEAHLGCTLVRRTTRRLELTQEGQLFYHRCKQVLKEIKTMEQEVKQAKNGEIHGDIILAASSTFVRGLLLSKFKTFLEIYPHISIRLVQLKSLAVLFEDKVDALISTTYNPDPALHCQTLYRGFRHVYAAPSYLEKYGTPKTLAELKNHNCLLFGGYEVNRVWRFSHNQTMTVQGNFSTSSGTELIAAACLGIGLIWALDEFVQEEVQNGNLVQVPLDAEGSPTEVYLYYKPVLANTALAKFITWIGLY